MTDLTPRDPDPRRSIIEPSGWKRELVGLGWDRLVLVTMVPAVFLGLFAAIALTVVIAAIGGALDLHGTIADVGGVVAMILILVVLFGVPILLLRRVRRAFPPELFPTPASDDANPVRRSTDAFLADVARLDARFASTSAPPADAYDSPRGDSQPF